MERAQRQRTYRIALWCFLAALLSLAVVAPAFGADAASADTAVTNGKNAAAATVAKAADKAASAQKADAAATEAEAKANAAAVKTAKKAVATQKSTEAKETATKQQAQAAKAQAEAEKAAADALKAAASVKAQASALKDGHVYEIKTAQNGKVVDLAYGTTNVQMYAENRTPNQWWKVDKNSDGTFYLVSEATGKVLATDNASTSADANVVVRTKTSSKTMKWTLQSHSDGTYSLVNKASGLMLNIAGGTGDGANVTVTYSNLSKAQKWTFNDLTAMWKKINAEATSHKGTIPNGTYIVSSALGNKQVLDISEGSKNNGGNAQIFAFNGTTAQQWKIKVGPKGFATIKNVNSDRVLDCMNGSGADGTNVQQWAKNNSRAQKWIIIKSTNGRYIIKSALWTDMSLDVKGGKDASGTNVQIYTTNKFDSQKWWLVNANPSVPATDTLDTSEWYSIKADSDISYLLDIASADSKDGANVDLYSSNDTLAQLFKLQSYGSYYYIVNAKTSKVLDIDAGGFAPGTNVQQWRRVSGEKNQLFSLKKVAKKTYAIINVRTGLALTASDMKDGANVYADYYTGKAKQHFRFIAKGELISKGVHTITPSIASKLAVSVMDDSAKKNADVKANTYQGGLGQKFDFIPVAGKTNVYTITPYCSGLNLAAKADGNVEQVVADASKLAQQWEVSILRGAYTFRNLKYNKMMDMCNAGTTSGTNIQVFKSNATDSQRWELANAALISDGTYTLKSAMDETLALAVKKGGLNSTDNVIIGTADEGASQKWVITHDDKTGNYTLVNCKSYLALDVENAVSDSGTNVQQFTWNDTTAQKWAIKYVGNGYFEIMTGLNTERALTAKKAASGANVFIKGYEDQASQMWRLAMLPNKSSVKLDGVDISHWETNINVGSLNADFIIMKATEGADYVDPTWEARAKQAVASGKLLGLYHFARVGSATAQADFFVKTIGGYVGKAVLALDWEDRPEEKIVTQGTKWAKTFLDRVYKLTGVRPVLYTGTVPLQDYDWSTVAPKYQLWYPRYLNENAGKTGYIDKPVMATTYNNKAIFTDWKSPLIYQYSSTGKLSGYSGNLDMNKFFGSRTLWTSLAAKS